MKQSRLITALTPFVMALPLAMDIYIPALPGMAAHFQVSPAAMQLTLTLFMLSAAAMQLIIGPLSDQLGRRATLVLSAILFGIGSMMCAGADTLTFLVMARMIQAAGSCGLFVLGFAIVRDASSGVQSAKIYAYLSSVIAFSPMFAPFIGSFLDLAFGWRATFWGVFVVAIWALASVIFLLHETLPRDRRRPFRLSIFKDYLEIIQHPRFFWYTLISAMGMSYFYLFCAMSPYIIITLLHIPEAHYGYYFCFMGVSLFIGSMMSGKVVQRIGIYKTNVLGLGLALAGGLIMTVWYWCTGLSIDNFIWPMLLIGIGGAFQFGVATGGSMDPFPEKAGAAAGLGGAFRFAFLSAIGSIVITKDISSTLPLCVTAVIFSIIGFVILVWRRADLV
jgi:DHA1 family bicyclomycin/chloramphenicol resistance-like MFS transporter